jgi:hypothetical protein
VAFAFENANDGQNGGVVPLAWKPLLNLAGRRLTRLPENLENLQFLSVNVLDGVRAMAILRLEVRD